MKHFLKQTRLLLCQQRYERQGAIAIPADITTNLSRITELLSEIREFDRANGARGRLEEDSPRSQTLSIGSTARYTHPTTAAHLGKPFPRTGNKSKRESNNLSTSTSWDMFSLLGPERARYTPTFECPHCFKKAHETRSQQREKQNDDEACEKHWYGPHDLQRHINWCHPLDGTLPQDFESFNGYILNKIVDRCVGAKRNRRHNSTGRTSSAGVSSSSLASPPQPFNLILLVDLANVVLDAGASVLSLPQSAEARDFFSKTAVAICVMHETLIPHSSLDVDALFALSLMNENSDFFPFYSVTGLEAGDLASAAFVSGLMKHAEYRQPTERTNCKKSDDEASLVDEMAQLFCAPPVALITKDLFQRTCMTEAMFKGRVFAPLTGGFSRTTILETCRRAVREGRRN